MVFVILSYLLKKNVRFHSITIEEGVNHESLADATPLICVNEVNLNYDQAE